MLGFPASTMTAKGQALQTRLVIWGQISRREMYKCVCIHTFVSGLNAYHTLFECIYVSMYIHTCTHIWVLDMSCFYRFWLLLLLHTLFSLRHFKHAGLIVFHM